MHFTSKPNLYYSCFFGIYCFRFFSNYVTAFVLLVAAYARLPARQERPASSTPIPGCRASSARRCRASSARRALRLRRPAPRRAGAPLRSASPSRIVADRAANHAAGPAPVAREDRRRAVHVARARL